MLDHSALEAKLITFLAGAVQRLGSALIVSHARADSVRKRHGNQWYKLKLIQMTWKDWTNCQAGKKWTQKSVVSIFKLSTFYSRLPGKLQCLYKESNPRSKRLYKSQKERSYSFCRKLVGFEQYNTRFFNMGQEISMLGHFWWDDGAMSMTSQLLQLGRSL